jgi:hypothetical protein
LDTVPISSGLGPTCFWLPLSDTLVPSADSKLILTHFFNLENDLEFNDFRIKVNLLEGVAAVGVHFAVG